MSFSSIGSPFLEWTWQGCGGDDLCRLCLRRKRRADRIQEIIDWKERRVMYDVVTFGEAMVRLSPPHFQRLEQTRSLDLNVGGRN